MKPSYLAYDSTGLAVFGWSCFSDEHAISIAIENGYNVFTGFDDNATYDVIEVECADYVSEVDLDDCSTLEDCIQAIQSTH